MNNLTIEQLRKQFQDASQSRLTGKLEIRFQMDESEPGWYFFFLQGRLIWCSGGKHRIRRWYRLVMQACPGIDPRSVRLRAQDVSYDWEYPSLAMLIRRQQISHEKAFSLVEQNALEILFDIVHRFTEVDSLHCLTQNQPSIGEPLILLNAEQVLNKTQQMWEDWCRAGLKFYSPNFAPVIQQPEELQKRTSSNSYMTLQKLLTGNSTLRDLAVVMNRDVLTVSRSLLSYLQQGIIGLQLIADLPNPYGHMLTPSGTLLPTATSPLVLCIDDSLQVCQSMEWLFTQAGYRFISIRDSFQALPTVLEQKPDLIFLDLMMPIANGYEICAQIRRVPALKNTPIVILTGNDGIVDRVRAKMVGASDFLGKPIEPGKIMTVARKYLAPPSHLSSTLGGSSPLSAFSVLNDVEPISTEQLSRP